MIGHNISNLRKQRGFTLSELSERTGISKSYLSNIERNLKQNPSIHVMEKIALVLKVDLKTLLKIAVEAETNQQLDQEWLEFIADIMKSGIDKASIQEYRILIEFMKWHHEKVKTLSSSS
ncbi:helix-turn-helix domain-containing protein [Paenibacillus roseipurpureus]|uniref:Helix-turn-helix transcriptional regulator n=1 Tax=Paenibacillus roseopurpureus TaxID=2918901 RepID=A0AA96LMM1_9BACL|nr:helix-turn-helix transcriptional regulator [Paenibacillus sp. MBLB1832]WNR43784.1 helix-turn-helix transcriptional regulator [Paenibacillus sp. MBLB1832]